MIVPQETLWNIIELSDIYYPTEYTTWLLGQEKEERLIKTELEKTVAEFIIGFKKMIIVLCRFHHERAGELRPFVDCQHFWINMACGHPRVIRAKFKIAYMLLHRVRAITKNKMEEYRDMVWHYTDQLTAADFRGAHGYSLEYANGWIPDNSPTGQKMHEFQQEFGVRLTSLRDEIVQKLEIIFK